MSKPVEVVVVVVFVKKKLGPKYFDQKKNPRKKTLGLKVLDPKRKFGYKIKS